MEVKVLEIRDRSTYFAAVCVDMNPIAPMASESRGGIAERIERSEAQRYHLRRLGYPCDGLPNIALFHLSCNGGPVWNDPFGWRDSRTYQTAHNYIIEHWRELKDGDVVDVEFILGETTVKALSERDPHWIGDDP
jgi:hypothetical protein